MKQYNRSTEFCETLIWRTRRLIGVWNEETVTISTKLEDIQFAQDKLNEEYKDEIIVFTDTNTKFDPGSIELRLQDNKQILDVMIVEDYLPEGFCPYCGRHD